ncbi:hypothetical protein, partial [Staphylococcus nepalensis]|uniref:hypothetical protein n=1 Tax=Staphylococcus nepalensis TaxID=214473 RepID=UPI00285FCDA0
IVGVINIILLHLKHVNVAPSPSHPQTPTHNPERERESCSTISTMQVNYTSWEFSIKLLKQFNEKISKAKTNI